VKPTASLVIIVCCISW